MGEVGRDLTDRCDPRLQLVERLIHALRQTRHVVIAFVADAQPVAALADRVKDLLHPVDAGLVSPRDEDRKTDRQQKREPEAPAKARGEDFALFAQPRIVAPRHQPA